MNKIAIYKASAGSGKTYRLVVEYLKLLIEEPSNYRHILAVTFTNKATSEMKERVISELFKITNEKSPSNMAISIMQETGKSLEKIKEKAQAALEYILHDYGRFSISTIDSFFQKVLRAFAKELGLYGAYAVELDQDMILEEACSRLLVSVDKDKDLHNWLLKMSENQLESGGKWQVNEKILNFGKEIFKESFYPYLDEKNDERSLRDKITDIRAVVSKIKKEYKSKCQDLGKQGLKIIHDAGLDIKDFAYGKNGFANQFEKLEKFTKDANTFGSRFTLAIGDLSKWYSAKSDKKDIICGIYNDLNDVMVEIDIYIKKESTNYYSATLIEENLFVLGIAFSLVEKIREIGEENNSLLISEGAQIIKKIIGDNDAPFIYEKVGNTFTNYMIDEFQDTSVTQWANFKPLVQNSLSEGYSNLIVGDVKQSIYRWRNSDWQLLNSKIVEDLNTFNIETVTLNSNWRSSKNIVSFNNAIFREAPKSVQYIFNGEFSKTNTSNNISNAGQAGDDKKNGKSALTSEDLIPNVYEDAQQTASNKVEGGKIELCFIESDNSEEYNTLMVNHLINTIKSIQDKEVKAKDIAILIRSNDEASMIASAIMSYTKSNPDQHYNFNFISDDALWVSNAISIKFLILMANYMITPSDEVLKASLIFNFSHYILPQLMTLGFDSFQIDENGNSVSTENKIDFNPQIIIDENIKKAFFPFFDHKGINSVPSQWAYLPVNEFISKIITTYKLDQINGEQANIQAFKDLVFDFGKREPLTLHKMLSWWNDKGMKCKLQSSGDQDAIKIMTIHKSKGLEFPYVIIPFCNWNLGLSNKYYSLIWCDTKNSVFSDLPIVPIRIKDEMSKSIFSNRYYEEMMLSYIDNLNVLYVALTRAVNGLYIFAKKEEPKNVSNVNQLLLQIISSDNLGLEEESSESPYFIYSTGEIQQPQKEKATQTIEKNLYTNKTQQSGYAEKLRIRVNYEDFLSEDETLSKINQGKCIHSILSSIITTSDIPMSIQSAIENGSISQSESEDIKKQIEDMVANPIARNWFNGSMKVVNETAILEPQFQLRRPDRVMIGEKEIVVVDYKSGKKRKSHSKQMNDYINLLKKVSSLKVSGYIWYITENEIVSPN